ncbi:MAG: sulfurtransferase [Desulfamplus sp.]|nr:sulfurtransferase [Desulfamplus sp.]
MKKIIFVILAIIIPTLTFIYTVTAGGSLTIDSLTIDPNKRTQIGKYATSLEAYGMWKANPDKIKIIDCRTEAEYTFVGHPEMAYNIPSKVWTGEWNAAMRNYELRSNPDFGKQVKKRFDKNDTIMIMCRSGHRSAASVNLLAKEGFTNVYNIIDGFEGDKVRDRESYYNGKRLKNGWKNSGAPWTYDLNPDLVYLP